MTPLVLVFSVRVLDRASATSARCDFRFAWYFANIVLNQSRLMLATVLDEAKIIRIIDPLKKLRDTGMANA